MTAVMGDCCVDSSAAQMGSWRRSGRQGGRQTGKHAAVGKAATLLPHRAGSQHTALGGVGSGWFLTRHCAWVDS